MPIPLGAVAKGPIGGLLKGALGAIPGAGLAMQVLPSLFGLAGNLIGKKRRQAEEGKASKGYSQLTDVLKGNLDQDYFDSTEAMGAMKEIDENTMEANQQINATANVNGLTDEARIAMMGNNMKAKQGAYSGMARQADLWRQRNLQSYQGSLGGLFNVGQANRENFNQSLTNVVGGAQGAIDGATNAGAFDSWMTKGAGKVVGAASKAAGTKTPTARNFNIGTPAGNPFKV